MTQKLNIYEYQFIQILHGVQKKNEKQTILLPFFIFIRRERAARERLKEKRVHSMTKQARQAPTLDSL